MDWLNLCEGLANLAHLRHERTVHGLKGSLRSSDGLLGLMIVRYVGLVYGRLLHLYFDTLNCTFLFGVILEHLPAVSHE